MNFSIDSWMRQYQEAVRKQFGDRIWLIGLQGSYGRDEATEESDIDVVFILDHISIEDLRIYSAALDTIPNRDKICGFVSGREELLSWEPSDLFQFYYDTTPIFGSLDILLRKIKRDDIYRAIWTGTCNIYHMATHNLIHEKNTDILKDLYKSATFTLQAIAFLQTGRYEKKKSLVRALLKESERKILDSHTILRQRKTVSQEEFFSFSNILLEWASKWIKRCAENQ